MTLLDALYWYCFASMAIGLGGSVALIVGWWINRVDWFWTGAGALLVCAAGYGSALGVLWYVWN